MKLLDYAKLCQSSYAALGGTWTDVYDLRFRVFNYPEKQVVCFRGSSNIKNWVRDFSFWPVRSPKGYLAHDGFTNAFKVVEPTLKKLIDPAKPITATGHSLGGAMAVIAGEAFNCPVVTFGCPRVYFRLSRAPLMDHTRIVCDDDPVPDVPLLMFHHLCPPAVVLQDSDGEFLNPEDHDIHVYISRLEAAYAAGKL